MSTLWVHIKQVIRFCISGGIGVLVYYVVLYGLTEYAHVWYLTSSVVAFCLDTGLSFILQKHWTFQNKETEKVRQQLVVYIMVKIGLLVTNTGFLYAGVQYLHLWYIWAQLILTIILSIADFFITKKIFRNPAA